MTRRKRYGKAGPAAPPPGLRTFQRRPRLALILATTVAAIVVAVGALLVSPAGRNLAGLDGGGSSPLTAAVVDQLGATQPNPDFVEAATGGS